MNKERTRYNVSVVSILAASRHVHKSRLSYLSLSHTSARCFLISARTVTTLDHTTVPRWLLSGSQRWSRIGSRSLCKSLHLIRSLREILNAVLHQFVLKTSLPTSSSIRLGPRRPIKPISFIGELNRTRRPRLPLNLILTSLPISLLVLNAFRFFRYLHIVNQGCKHPLPLRSY